MLMRQRRPWLPPRRAVRCTGAGWRVCTRPLGARRLLLPRTGLGGRAGRVGGGGDGGRPEADSSLETAVRSHPDQIRTERDVFGPYTTGMLRSRAGRAVNAYRIERSEIVICVIPPLICQPPVFQSSEFLDLWFRYCGFGASILRGQITAASSAYNQISHRRIRVQTLWQQLLNRHDEPLLVETGKP